MLRLRKILLQDNFYYGIFLLSIMLLGIRLLIPKESIYSLNTKEITGKIIKIEEKENQTIYEIKGKESVLATTLNKKDYHLGDIVTIKGQVEKPSKNTTKYLFNYEEYLKRKNIFFIVKIEKIILLQNNKNIWYKGKERIEESFHKNAYLYTFILGDKSLIKDNVLRSYQSNGISHLFAISGMHITLLSSILKKILKKIFQEETTYKIISIILLCYVLLVGCSPSIIRGVLFYILFEGNKIYYFYIKKENLFLLIISIAITQNPYNIYDPGFEYSYLISFSLLRLSSTLTANNKIISLLKVSITSFLVGIPISLKNYYEINLLGCIYNLFYVPFISTIVFPFTLVLIFIKPLEPIYNGLIYILEESSLLLERCSIGRLTFQRLPTIIYIVYFLLILLYLLTYKKKYIYLFLISLSIHFMIPYIINETYVEALDVGQGDFLLLHTNHKNIVVDTGGKRESTSLFFKTISPYLKSKGISKIHYLIISHGDFDHMGEAINIVNNFKVEKVIFNCGEYNDLESELIKVLDKKKIKYYSCIKELNIDKNILYFLQTKEYDNENDNSNVIYMELNNYKFMFMGDASISTEKEILNKYNLQNIDVLKVGHHGSNTSSSKEFINDINPKYAIISVGKNNRYGHPNKEVLDNLKNSKIYRTDKNGSILFQINNNKLKIETGIP